MCAQKTQELNQSAQVKIINEQELGLILPKREINNSAFAIYIRRLLQNWRQGTVGCKGRSDVNFSNKKPWKQKGTGRARAGSARSPLWRGGGVIFGPQARVRKLKISKSLRSGVLNTLFWDLLEQERILQVNWNLSQEIPRTREAVALLKQLELLGKKLNIILPVNDILTYSSFINIPNVNVLFFDEVNAYDLAGADYLIVFNKDFASFKEMVSQWI